MNSYGDLGMLHFLSDDEIEAAQKKGYMCEHLLSLYSLTANRTALYDHNYPVYFSGYEEVDLVLFGIIENKKAVWDCIRDLLRLPLKQLNIISPDRFLPLKNVTKHYVDWDYHINVSEFDLNLKGKQYKPLRYRINQAEKLGYTIRIGRTITSRHLYILSRHIARHPLDVWDLEELVSLPRFFTEHNHGFMMEVHHNGKLLGFDVIDFFEEKRVMAVPLGIYLDAPSLTDYIMYENLRYAKNAGYGWLDVGLTCRNPGLRDFKEKWLAKPKYKLCVQTIDRPNSTLLPGIPVSKCSQGWIQLN
ncbi:MAG: DUF2156 domain-containing protein [Candidatus Bathyarchaeota archaeon]|nr:MAG: DUF2156 domain-containing protein [Candidatus Bathyarchaeota archaeon]